MNIVLLLLEIVFASFVLLFLYKKYKIEGMYIYVVVFSILSGIICQKNIEIFNLEVNLGFAINTLIFIATSIIVQKKGPKETEKLLSIIIFSNIIMYIISTLVSLLSISNINELTNQAYDKLFYLSNRMYFSNIISLILPLWINSIIYHQIRQVKNKIWISNVLSTIIIHFIESTLFCVIAYLFKIPLVNIIELIAIRYLFKVTIGLIGTSIIYLTNTIDK